MSGCLRESIYRSSGHQASGLPVHQASLALHQHDPRPTSIVLYHRNDNNKPSTFCVIGTGVPKDRGVRKKDYLNNCRHTSKWFQSFSFLVPV